MFRFLIPEGTAFFNSLILSLNILYQTFILMALAEFDHIVHLVSVIAALPEDKVYRMLKDYFPD